ncbi:HK97 family phage prohead protease [Eggerthella guodeyinii]|uniref:HK97 family phage prohead protease n=1 Tax=Eggerthella guodeyinii TaxID=2690837 RepID=A0A6N7RN43_9ACTN|nr:HK97 family phage prohead protease [Eggerthella guodeyinii]MRX82250.1 HK97 family phage prohead protease [Eggerthella guodeyinii]
MPAKPIDRQYRAMTVTLTPPEEGGDKRLDSEYYVEGYASTFNDPYVLFEDYDGNEYREIVSPDAFEGTDMTDVIMQYDHRGHVYARMSNGTLVVEPDEHGLFVAADLGRSQRSRDLYEEIQNGLTTRMSWAFSIAADEYDRETKTTTITRVKKIYDVSAVSLPADPNTEISARNLLDGVIGQSAKELGRRNRALAIARAAIAINGKGLKNGH